MSPSSADVDLQLKKRARRRLIGAVAFAGLAAVVLPMVMDDEPKQQIQEVQIRIPGQDQTPFAPKLAKAPVASEAPASPPPAKAETPPPPPAPVSKAAEKPVEKKVEKPAVPEKAEKTEKAEKVEKVEKAPAPPAPKPAEKAVDKAPADNSEAQRAAAILAGKPVEPRDRPAAAANGNGQFVILIGAFANPANVKQLQSKIGEMGIKVFTEPLESPGGTKTRVRAGPFPNREAADKALEKIKRIGVNGVVAAKQ